MAIAWNPSAAERQLLCCTGRVQVPEERRLVCRYWVELLLGLSFFCGSSWQSHARAETTLVVVHAWATYAWPALRPHWQPGLGRDAKPTTTASTGIMLYAVVCCR